ncbi:MAG: hypothetical protein M1827_001599 [Pycnora praestabilis]|nr:MAG: hypothetical protein M1827_001599 [Pycnora praestabilis]
MEATHRQTRIPKTPCRFFLQGKCNYGKNCRSSHDVATTTTRSDIESKDRKQKNKKHEPDPAYAAWRLLLRLRRPLSEQEMSQFFASTLTLVSADEAQLMYETVAALASEDGLSRIGRLTSTSLSDMAPAPRIAYFTKTVLPFCQAITTPRVLSSLINEIQIGTIYNFLLGVGGTRSIPFFHGIAITLFDIKFAAETTEVTDELVPESLAAVLTTLAQLFERNQTAPMLEDLQVVVKDITACMGEADEHAMSSPHMQTAFRSLSRIQVKLGWAKSITVWEKPTSILNGGPPIFDIQEDPPGQLSPKGQRHDNDHEDIEKIRIMPTAEEILSERPEYLPVSEPSRLHYPGMRGLIDRHFRLVREDTVGPMRDSVRLVIASLRQDPEQLGSTSDRTPHSGRVLVFKNATVTSLSFDKLKGLQISAEFDQPNSVKKLKKPKDRQDWWQDSKQLTIDSLVCLVDSTGGSIFLSVSDKPPEKSDEKYKSNGTQAEVAELIEARSWRRQDSTDIESAKSSTSLWDNRLRASVRMQLVDHDLNIERALARFEEQTRKQPKMTQQLVGFPGVLLPSFSPTLKALQEMSRSHVFPFTDFIATDQSEALLDVPAPSYSLQAGFNFNLSCIMDGARNMLLSPRDRFSMPALTGNSMLDPAQCESLVAALSRSLALIQGPPGTGKSYVAVQMVKILLEQRLQGDIGPIICMQFLEHLIRDGVEQIIRIGSRSASEMLKSVNLREVSQHIDRTKTEKTREWECHRALETTAGNVDNMLESLQRVKDPLALRQYLEQHHVRHCHELFADDEDGWETVHHGQNKYEYALEAWLGAQPAEQHIHTQDRSVARISQLPLPSLSKKERWKLYNDWIATMRSQIHEGLMDVLRTYEEEKLDLDRCRREKDLHCLEKAQLIGLTTTGLARHLDTLKRLPSKILICEEAGEVLEAHLLTALQLPHIEHTILIGDHEQLRPQIQNHDLSIENHKTMEKYALDVSMFERLVKPYLPGQPSVPYSTLRMQRRMHPSISQLIRMTLYPNLLDHPDMIDYPGVSGLKERLYWLDHREREVQPDPSQPLQVSRSNDFEVDMVAAIVSHLFRQGAYQDEEIAVLTPYVRQLQKIRERLSASHEIVVGERDLEELDKAGLEEPGTMATNIATTAVTSSVQRTTLLKALRVATIDNFQGEEAKVIIISLVRSNDQRNCGFLKTSNRINVLLVSNDFGAPFNTWIPVYASDDGC